MPTKLTHRFLLAAFAMLCMLTMGACSTTSHASSTGQYQVSTSRTGAFLSQVFGGQTVPDGVNNWACQPAENQNPVVLIHGTFSSSLYSFGALGPILANQNLCVYSIDYGAAKPGDWFKGVGPVDESAKTVADFVNLVKTKTGRDKVTLVGHSQGGLIGFYYLKVLNGAEHVDQFVALAPSVNGTAIAKTPNRDYVDYCLACADQHPESALLRELKTGPITMPSVQYHVLVTKNDRIVVPVENQFVREPGVQNIYIQDLLPGKRVSHSGMLYDTETLDLIVKLVRGQAVQTASN